MDRWNALVRYDDQIHTAAEELRPFGDCWVDELGKAYFALNEHREYLANIVSRLTAEAEKFTRSVLTSLGEEVERGKARRWMRRFRHTACGELWTPESLNVLLGAEAQGYSLEVQRDGAFVVSKVGKGSSFLRTNYEIRRFGPFN